MIYQTTMNQNHNNITLTSLKTVSSQTWWKNVTCVQLSKVFNFNIQRSVTSCKVCNFVYCIANWYSNAANTTNPFDYAMWFWIEDECSLSVTAVSNQQTLIFSSNLVNTNSLVFTYGAM